MASSRQRLVVDSIHGDIRLNALESALIDTSTFQRLRHLKQLGMGHFTYPNATHTRFAHSLGVFAIMKRVLKLEDNPLNLSDTDKEDLCIAALFHDIGHYPYSHLMEQVDNVRLTEERVSSNGSKIEVDLTHEKYPNHEEVGKLITTTQGDILKLLDKERAEKIANLFTRSSVADQQKTKLIHSSLDMDRLDYLLRDARASGVPYGEIDLNYILSSLKVSPKGVLGVVSKAQTAAEQFLFARYFMHRAVYYHKTTFGIEEACRQLLRRCRDKGKYSVPKDGSKIREIVSGNKLLTFTDSFVDNIIRNSVEDKDPTIKQLAQTILYRKPPKLIREVCQVEKIERQTHNNCTTFILQCNNNLRNLAKKNKIPLGLFMMAEPKMVTLEKRGAEILAKNADELRDDPGDELIKVFDGIKDEPDSLVSRQDSMLKFCGGHGLQMARLYLISDDETLVQKVQKEVSHWS